MGLLQQAAGGQGGRGKVENRLRVNRRGSQRFVDRDLGFSWPGSAEQGEATRPKRTADGHTLGLFFSLPLCCRP